MASCTGDLTYARNRRNALSQLTLHYGSDYVFTVSDDGVWQASLISDPEQRVTGQSAEELRRAVMADQAGRATDGTIARLRRRELDDLRHHWDTAYWIQYDGLSWSASPLSEPGVLLTADSSRHLRDQIRDDYHHNDRRHVREPGQ